MNNNRPQETKKQRFGEALDHPWEVCYNSALCDIFRIRLEKIVQPVTMQEKMEELSKQIEQYYWDNVQTPEEFQMKRVLATRIHKVIRSSIGEVKGWDSGTMTLSGSSVTGIAGRNSDVDLCFWIPSAHAHFEANKECAAALLRIVEMRLRNDTDFAPTIHKMEFVNASIPILKMIVRDVASGEFVEADMSICTSPDGFVSGVHNSFLLRHYVRFDERVGPFCFFIKKWAEMWRIRAPTEGRFNSYCIVLLVIHYLQCGVFPAVIPNLTRVAPGFFATGEKEGMFNPIVDFGADLPEPILPNVQDCPETGGSVSFAIHNYIHYKGKNILNLGMLFLGFLAYYNYFEFDKNYIDMKSSCCKPRTLRGCKTVDLVDPIDQHNPARTVQRDNMPYIKDVFSITLEMFEGAMDDPDAFPSLADILFKGNNSNM